MPMRLTAQGSKPMRLTRCGGRPQVPLGQLEASCCAEGGHHQLPFVCAWRDRVGVGVSVRPQMDAVQSRKMADEACVWSLEGRVEKARVSVIVQHLCRDRPQPLNLLHVAWMNGHFYIGGGRGVNKQALRASQWRWARGGSMAKSRLHRMHPRWLKATTPKRLTHGHLGLKVSKSHGSKPNHVFI